LADDFQSIRIVITLDTDDATITPEFEKQILEYGTIQYHSCTSKIDACNRDLEGDEEIIMLGSDDMIAEIKGWDTIVKEKMLQEFPDLDGALFFNDGYRADLNTMTIWCRKLYNKYNYLYHPAYKSFYCDEEWTIVGKKLNILRYDPRVIFRHVHYSTNPNKNPKDQLYSVNDRYWNRDKLVFQIRQKQGFPNNYIQYYCLEQAVAEADTNLDQTYRLKSAISPSVVFISINDIDTIINDYTNKKISKLSKLYIHSKNKFFTNVEYSKLKDISEQIYATNNVSSANTLPLGLIDDSVLPHLVYSLNPMHEKNILCSCDRNLSIFLNKEWLASFSNDIDIININTNILQKYLILSQSKYVVCFSADQTDTHLIYEALHFGCVPIVLTGPLNSYYEMIGCHIIDSWDTLVKENLI
jgi:hypothetical protein